MQCPQCEKETEHRHVHDCIHGLPYCHMADSERYECLVCGYAVYKHVGEQQGLKYILD
jgi:C4-type Zn-finger protein